MNDRAPLSGRSGGLLLVILVAVLLAGLPLSVWLDLRTLSTANLSRQAGDLNTVITGIRGFYTNEVVAHVLAAHTGTVVTPDFETVPGAIPLPATFSLELGRIIGENQANIRYRFVSDYPFKGRARHELDAFERTALVAFRNQPERKQFQDVSWSGFNDRVRIVAPIIMGQTCVACHNTHPDSPKRDWKVGDVRGIQEISITAPVATNVFSFRFLLSYFALAGAIAFAFIVLQRRQTAAIRHMNQRLSETNGFLASISSKVSRYLSPQIYRSIFSGENDVTIHTQRKRLSIMLSDITDFTALAELLEPEELTSVLNEYFTEMSNIAFRHGGTVDKFVGDAIIIFFGDPETLGVDEDAKACVRMAVDMQARLVELNEVWRARGVQRPILVRMGIHSGYCNVGNFGSDQRMDYTIIGGAVNFSARLQAAAQSGSIVISYETYTLVRDIVAAHALAPVNIKGFNREVVPYVVEALLGVSAENNAIFTKRVAGLDFYLDVDRLEASERARVLDVMREAMNELERREAAPPIH